MANEYERFNTMSPSELAIGIKSLIKEHNIITTRHTVIKRLLGDNPPAPIVSLIVQQIQKGRCESSLIKTKLKLRLLLEELSE